MTDNEKLSCLIDRPCTACKFHKEEGCSKWSCVFEEKADVSEREKGTWLEHYDCFSCSCCHEEFDILEGTPKDNDYNFCPNCGADMKGR